MTPDDSDSAALREAVTLADEILELVRTHTPAGVQSRDRNDQILVLALGRAFRCFRSIRDIAALHGEPDDIAVLTRALMSAALRSLWLAVPDDPEERLRRGRVIELEGLESERRKIERMRALGMEVDSLPDESLGRIEALKGLGIGGPPPEEVIARELEHEHLYAAVYREASGIAHFSLAAALQNFVVGPGPGPIESFDGLKVRFQEGNPARAEAALLLACLIYVAFLEASEPIVPLGVAERAKKLLTAHAEKRHAERAGG